MCRISQFTGCKACDESCEPASCGEKLKFTLNVYAVIVGHTALDVSASPDRFSAGFCPHVFCLGGELGSITHFMLPGVSELL